MLWWWCRCWPVALASSWAQQHCQSTAFAATPFPWHPHTGAHYHLLHRCPLFLLLLSACSLTCFHSWASQSGKESIACSAVVVHVREHMYIDMYSQRLPSSLTGKRRRRQQERRHYGRTLAESNFDSVCRKELQIELPVLSCTACWFPSLPLFLSFHFPPLVVCIGRCFCLPGHNDLAPLYSPSLFLSSSAFGTQQPTTN